MGGCRYGIWCWHVVAHFWHLKKCSYTKHALHSMSQRIFNKRRGVYEMFANNYERSEKITLDLPTDRRAFISPAKFSCLTVNSSNLWRSRELCVAVGAQHNSITWHVMKLNFNRNMKGFISQQKHFSVKFVCFRLDRLFYLLIWLHCLTNIILPLFTEVWLKILSFVKLSILVTLSTKLYKIVVFYNRDSNA